MNLLLKNKYTGVYYWSLGLLLSTTTLISQILQVTEGAKSCNFQTISSSEIFLRSNYRFPIMCKSDISAD